MQTPSFVLNVLPPLTAGFGLGLGLIVAIGAQNVFVLRQGLKRQHVFWVCLICALSDAILVTVGVAGFGSLAQVVPWFEGAMRLGGALFLTLYGARAWWSAWSGGAALTSTDQPPQSDPLWGVLLSCLALTWLNPHVYLDTVVLLGSISAQYDPGWAFGVGAVSAGTLFFFALGYGAQVLAPLFARPRAWQLLDLLVGGVMFLIAFALLRG